MFSFFQRHRGSRCNFDLEGVLKKEKFTRNFELALAVFAVPLQTILLHQNCIGQLCFASSKKFFERNSKL